MRGRTVVSTVVMIGTLAGCGSDSPDRAVPMTGDGEIDIAALAAFVEEQRGHPLVEQPRVEFVDQATVASRMPPDALTESDWDLVRLLDMVPPDADRAAVNTALNNAVNGVCCPLEVVDTGDLVRDSTVALHELVHFSDATLLFFPDPDPSLESALVMWSAAEGNAERIAAAYLESLGSGRDRNEENARPAPAGVPADLTKLFDAPYSHGFDFMTAVAEDGGEAAIDTVLGDPPISAEQVMFPDAFFSGDEPLAVGQPALPDGHEVRRAGTLGTFLLELIIDSERDDRVDDILSRWAGDSYVVTGTVDQICLSATVVMDDEQSATDLVDAVRNVGFGSDGASVSGSAAELSRCLAR